MKLIQPTALQQNMKLIQPTALRSGTAKPKTLILFVHGFLGSESSFCDFPLDLIQSLRQIHKISDIEARIFPFFQTKGCRTLTLET